MEGSHQKAKEKKKVSVIKTFPVQLGLVEIKKNLNVITNSDSKPSKEQIINQAIKFHQEGNISEASKYYQYCIDQGFNDQKVFFNYGSILQDLCKLKEAELSYSKAIEINPNFAEAHYNLGIILKDLGILQKAELSYHKAIKIKPNFAEAYYNRGNILRDLGRLPEAELSYRKAIEVNPDYEEAHSNLGLILLDLDKLEEAKISTRKAISLNPNFANAHLNLGIILRDLGNLAESFDSYFRVIEINPKYPNIYSLITEFLRDSDPSELNKYKLKKILNIMLEKNDVRHKELFNAFKFLYSNKIITNLEKLYSDNSKTELILNDKIIINALKKIIFTDPKLEDLLKKIRSKFCKKIAKNTQNITSYELQFIIALGEQCFLNEYVYSITKEEDISVNIIIKRCSNRYLNEEAISILSCYFPLYKLVNRIPSLKSFDSDKKSIKELIKLQIAEPLNEIELSQKTKRLGKINDDISQRVKSQYEKNPYPRWRYGNHLESQKISIAQRINTEIKPNYISQTIENEQVRVLIAGCGTGQQILHTQRYKNAQITAIDLSLSSLAYAQRKINELSIDKIKLIEMDILEVSLLKKQFDIIECGGVLHHMEYPSKGLRALLDVLKNNGFLKLGLYSQLARRNIIEARNYISSKKIQASDANIREFRQTVFSDKIPTLNSLSKSSDFYTLSSCRDLCFHTQEHRFTIKQLQDTLTSNQLKFLGFLLPRRVKSLYKNYFPEDKKQINLQNWARFEEKYPNTFTGMYQFWVCKTKI